MGFPEGRSDEEGMQTSRSRPDRPPAWFAVFAVGLLIGPAQAVQADDKPVPFDSQVRPILEARCVKCHGAIVRKGGLDLRRTGSILKGGDAGPAVVAGKPEESLLVEKIESGEMPPAKEGKLEPKQKDLIRRWVRGGVSSGRSAETATELASPRDPEPASRITEEDRRFWAYQPPLRPAPPRVTNANLVRNPGRRLPAREARGQGADVPPRCAAGGVAPSPLLRPGGPAADARTAGGIPPGRPARRRGTAGRSAAGVARLWRAVGAALARRRGLCRFGRLSRRRPASARGLAVSRLRHPGVQRGHALRPVPDRATGRRRAGRLELRPNR